MSKRKIGVLVRKLKKRIRNRTIGENIYFNLNNRKNIIYQNPLFSDLNKENITNEKTELNVKCKKIHEQTQTSDLSMNNSNEAEKYKIVEMNRFTIIKNQKYIIPFYKNSQTTNYKPKGLKNYTLNCYMNSLLQCFYYIKDFRDYFLSNKFEKFKCICNSLKDVMHGLNKIDEQSFYVPKALKNEIKKYEFFEDNKGADVTDLLFKIFDKLISELESNDDLSDKTVIYENNVEDKEVMFKDTFKDIDFEIIINKLFLGFYEKQYKCDNGHIKYYFQEEYHIMLPLQEIYENLNYKENLNLYDCLNYLYKNKNDNSSDKSNENINISNNEENNDLYEMCDKCEKHYILTEKIYRGPKILIIILDRGKNKKFNINVNFDETIDLNNYIDEENYKYSTNYKLIGVCSHFGSCGNCGHYKSICLCDDNNYYLFDDSFSDLLKKKNFYIGSPYILFYQRYELNELGQYIIYLLDELKSYIKVAERKLNRNKYIVKINNNKDKIKYEIINKKNKNNQFILEFDFSEFNIHSDNINLKIYEENKEENTTKYIHYKWNEKIKNEENKKKIKNLIDSLFYKFSISIWYNIFNFLTKFFII